MAELTPTFTVTSTWSGYTGASASGGAGLRDGIFTGTGSVWASDAPTGRISVDLGSAKTIQKIGIAPIPAVFDAGWGVDYLNGAKIQSSTNGSSWTDRATLSGHSEGSIKEYALSISARYWCIYNASEYLGLSEFRIYELEGAPTLVPADLTSTATLDAATIASKASISANDLTAAATLDAATIASRASIAANDLTASATLDAATIASKASISANDLTASATLDAATVASKASIAANDLTASATLDAATVVTSGTILANDLTAAASIDGATIVANAALSPADLTAASTIDGATITFHEGEFMAINISRHIPQIRSGEFSGGLALPAAGGALNLALDTNSVALAGPCELSIVPDEKIRLDCKNEAAGLDPAGSPLVLVAGVERRFTLPQGNWYLKATAYT